MRGLARITLLVLLSVAAHACGEPYLMRAAYEEARILWRREPIVHVLEREDLDPETHEKLLLVLAARAFAKDELGFEVGNSYTTLARVDGHAVAYVVTAAYRDRLEPYTWRYPIVGRVPYRGFFNPGNAEAYATELEARGLDTAVWPSTAFSTLGWFDDPLLSNMLESDSVELVTMVFHELTHAQVYVPSAAQFNESLANFAGHRAAIAFFCTGKAPVDDTRGEETPHPEAESLFHEPASGSLCQTGGEGGKCSEGHRRHVGGAPSRRTDRGAIRSRPPSGAKADGWSYRRSGSTGAERCARARARWHDERSYASVLAEAARALRALYSENLAPNLRGLRRTEILTTATGALSHQDWATTRYRGTDLTRFNNAVLLQQLLYRSELALFEDAWRSQGKSLRRTVRRIADALRSGGDPFTAVAALCRGVCGRQLATQPCSR
jgi:predicted aminopeptidase